MAGCETCRAVVDLIRGAGTATGARVAARLPEILTPAPAPTVASDAHAQKLVALKLGYERKLPSTDEDSVEHEHTRGIINGIQLAINVLRGAGVPIDDPPPAKVRKAAAAVTNGELSVMARALLAVLVVRKKPTSKELLGVLSGYAPSGPMNQALKSLRDGGYINGEGQNIVATERAREKVPTALRLPHGDDLLAMWNAKLGVMEGKLLSSIVAIGRQREGAITNQQIQTMSMYAASGPYNTSMKRLRNTNLIVRGTNRPIQELL